MNKFVKQVAEVYNKEAKFQEQANNYKKANAKLMKRLLPIDLGKVILKNNKITYQTSTGKSHSRKIKNLADFKKHFKVIPVTKDAPKSKFPINKSSNK